jgi:hypothetical protein
MIVSAGGPTRPLGIQKKSIVSFVGTYYVPQHLTYECPSCESESSKAELVSWAKGEVMEQVNAMWRESLCAEKPDASYENEFARRTLNRPKDWKSRRELEGIKKISAMEVKTAAKAARDSQEILDEIETLQKLQRLIKRATERNVSRETWASWNDDQRDAYFILLKELEDAVE